MSEIVIGTTMEEEKDPRYQASTTPDPQTAPLGSAFPAGNDIHSHGGNERPKVNGGGNPYAMTAESLIPRLANLYQEVKSR